MTDAITIQIGVEAEYEARKINHEALVPTGHDSENIGPIPVSPLVSAQVGQGSMSGMIMIRINTFVTSKYHGNKFKILALKVNDVLELVFEYDHSDKTPKSFNSWYMSLQYNLKDGNINTVKTYLRDTDPTTSRGTETTVVRAT